MEQLKIIEIETLKLHCWGMDSVEVAKEMGVSRRTIATRMHDVRLKLKAKNNFQAIYIAVKQNIIK